MAKMNMNRLREIVAEASDLIADYDTRRSAELGDAPKAMDSDVSVSQHEREMKEHYANMEKIAGPDASRIWESRR